jgi:hypothetical protein
MLLPVRNASTPDAVNEYGTMLRITSSCSGDTSSTRSTRPTLYPSTIVRSSKRNRYVPINRMILPRRRRSAERDRLVLP